MTMLLSLVNTIFPKFIRSIERGIESINDSFIIQSKVKVIRKQLQNKKDSEKQVNKLMNIIKTRGIYL